MHLLAPRMLAGLGQTTVEEAVVVIEASTLILEADRLNGLLHMRVPEIVFCLSPLYLLFQMVQFFFFFSFPMYVLQLKSNGHDGHFSLHSLLLLWF